MRTINKEKKESLVTRQLLKAITILMFLLFVGQTMENSAMHNHDNFYTDIEESHKQKAYNQHTKNSHSHTHQHTKHTSESVSALKMIETRPHLLQTLSLTPITIFFYGSASTPEYDQFVQTIPAYNNEFHSSTQTPLQFIFIPAQKFNLTRPNPSLSIYRKISNGQWLMYKGIFEKGEMFSWIKQNVIDPLKQLTGQEIDSMFVQNKKGFILVDFGQFYLLKAKIMLSQFCKKFELKCGKVSYTNKALNMITQLIQTQSQPEVPKLAYWNPKSQQFEIYTKDVGAITENQLMQLYSGHESLIPYEAELDVAKVIHPQTDIIQVIEKSGEGVDLDL